MRRKFVYDPDALHADGSRGAMVEVSTDYNQAPRGHFVQPDLPGYQSPVTGLWVEGRKQRREDLKRTGSRPYEGRAQEQKEANRQRAYAEQASERRLDETARRAYYQLSPDKRRSLERGG